MQVFQHQFAHTTCNSVDNMRSSFWCQSRQQDYPFKMTWEGCFQKLFFAAALVADLMELKLSQTSELSFQKSLKETYQASWHDAARQAALD